MIAATKILRFTNLFFASFASTVLATTTRHFLPTITPYLAVFYLLAMSGVVIVWWRAQTTGDIPGPANLPVIFAATLLGGLSWVL